MDYKKLIETRRKMMKNMPLYKSIKKKDIEDSIEEEEIDGKILTINKDNASSFKEGKPVKFSGIGRMTMYDGKPCVIVDDVNIDMKEKQQDRSNKDIVESPSA